MKIVIFTIGKIQKNYFQLAVADFINRLRHYHSVEVIAVKEEKITKSSTPSAVLLAEARHIQDKLRQLPVNYLVALDKSGTQLSSEAFASLLVRKMNENVKTLGLVIGGPFGLHASIQDLADIKLSLSPMTFLHEMSLVILLEQLYRAFTIISGEKYHK